MIPLSPENGHPYSLPSGRINKALSEHFILTMKAKWGDGGTGGERRANWTMVGGK
jgi:hypothetical protein